MKKLLFATPLILLVLHLGLEIAFRHVLPYAIIQPGRTPATIDPASVRLPCSLLSVQSDSIMLKGYKVEPIDQKVKAAVILIHGIGGNKSHFLSLAESLAERGYAAVAFDLRAHGESDGQFTTYGYYEKHDIKAIVNHIRSQDPDVPIGIWGGSLGGAVALQTMALDDRIDFGIVESTFRNLEEIMHDYQRRIVGVPMGYYMGKAVNKAEQIGKFEVGDVNPLKAAASIAKPVLIAHGDADRRISFEYGKSLYDQLSHPDKEWILVKGGKHIGLSDAGGVEYQNRLYSFLDRQTESE